MGSPHSSATEKGSRFYAYLESAERKHCMLRCNPTRLANSVLRKLRNSRCFLEKSKMLSKTRSE